MAPLGPPPPIRACLFDMDGLLLDTEDLYTAAVNAVLHEHNRPSLPWSIKAQLQGRPGPQASAIFQSWAKLPITTEQFFARQGEEQRRLFPTCKPLPGVEDLLSTLKGKVEMALATSSHRGNYNLKTAHLKTLMDTAFPEELKVLGDDPRIPKGRGKPCPDIYLLALECVNASIRKRREAGEQVEEITPAECLVFEDSVPGVEAGRRAGMQVIWVPMPGLLGEYKDKEKEVLAGRSGMVYTDTTVRDGEGDDMQRAPPGELGDAWGKRVESLENFDYKGYGIKI